MAGDTAKAIEGEEPGSDFLGTAPGGSCQKGLRNSLRTVIPEKKGNETLYLKSKF